MPSNIPPGSTVIGRMGIYRRLVEIPALRGSYARKFAAAAFVSAQTPLVVFIVYLLVARADLMLGSYDYLNAKDLKSWLSNIRLSRFLRPI